MFIKCVKKTPDLCSVFGQQIDQPFSVSVMNRYKMVVINLMIMYMMVNMMIAMMMSYNNYHYTACYDAVVCR